MYAAAAAGFAGRGGGTLARGAGVTREEPVAGYTLKNLKDDVEDSAVKFGLSPAMETRFARGTLGAEQVGVTYERLAPDTRAPFGHRHKAHEEVYVVVGGGGRAKLDDHIIDLRRWDVLRVSPATARHFEAGPDGLEVLAIGLPNTDPPDVETLPGWWSD
jgi:mannose-6-phosphate isomerase-like protein (cupin superfamily)